MRPPPGAAASMSTPGAVTSGLTAPPLIRGPVLEKSASLSARSTAPTVKASSALPGEPIEFGPELPAATAKRTPFSAVTLLTCASSGSISEVSSRPRLRLTMSAPWATAQSIPAMIPESEPPPSSSRTLALMTPAFGATPLCVPFDPAPLPAAVEATWVPWPSRSAASGAPLKFRAATTRPWRSGWVSSTPVSRTAILTPSPS